MEVLSILLRRVVAGGFLFGCSFRGNEGFVFNISHLLFADNTMVFCEVSEDQMLYLSWVLFWFEASSSLKINLEKSELISVGRLNNVEVLVAELGCQIGSLPSTYLGLPLGAGHKAVIVWDSVEEQIQKSLALWKRSFISKGGRITLIKSSLASLPPLPDVFGEDACFCGQEVGKVIEKLPLERRVC